MKKTEIGKSSLYYDEEKYIDLFEKIENNQYEIVKILKDDKRSRVARIKIQDEEYIYKIPLEKNRRKWQRFLSIFRKSESYREFKNLNKILKEGFNAPIPFLTVEKKKGCVVVDSYIIMSYVKGEDSTVKDVDLVIDELRKIHKKGYLHGDSHLGNFMIEEKKVYLIDTKLIKNRYFKFGEIFEFIYLEESCYCDIDYDKSSYFYKIAMLLKRYLLWLGRVKKRLKGK